MEPNGVICPGQHLFSYWLGVVILARCLTAPSHYLNQCLTHQSGFGHSPKGNFAGNAQGVYPWDQLECNVRLQPHFQGAKELIAFSNAPLLSNISNTFLLIIQDGRRDLTKISKYVDCKCLHQLNTWTAVTISHSEHIHCFHSDDTWAPCASVHCGNSIHFSTDHRKAYLRNTGLLWVEATNDRYRNYLYVMMSSSFVRS